MSLSTSAVSDVFAAARALFSERRLPSSQMTENDVKGIIETLNKVTVAQVGLAKQAEEVREQLQRSPPPRDLPLRPISVLTVLLVFHAFRVAVGAQEDLKHVAEPLQGSDQPEVSFAPRGGFRRARY